MKMIVLEVVNKTPRTKLVSIVAKSLLEVIGSVSSSRITDPIRGRFESLMN